MHILTISPKEYLGGSDKEIGVVSTGATLLEGGYVTWGAGLLFIILLAKLFKYSSALAPSGFPCQFSASSIPEMNKCK